MASITINLPDEQKNWLQSKTRNMTAILQQMIEEEMTREQDGRVRFLDDPKKIKKLEGNK